jgi:hypothetical protein
MEDVVEEEVMRPRFMHTMTAAILPNIPEKEAISRRVWVKEYTDAPPNEPPVFKPEAQGCYIFGGQLLPDDSKLTSNVEQMMKNRSGSTNEFSNELWLVKPDYKRMQKVLI